ncbi:MAG: hypothetical protein ABIH38_04850 [Patescibacteria group bacterium]
MSKKTLAPILTLGLIAALLIAGLSFGYVKYIKNENTNTAGPDDKENENTNQLIGGDTDEHGCLIAAGYSWCESEAKCLRIWEEDCPAGTNTNVSDNTNSAVNTNTAADETTDWLTYTNQEWKYSFMYPPEFAVQVRSVITGEDDPTGDSTVIWSNLNWRDLIPEGTESIGDQFNVTILANKSAADFEEDMGSNTIIASEAVRVAGIDGTKNTYDTSFGDIDYLHLTANNIPYLFSFTNVSNEDQATVDQILSSFQFFEVD